MGQSDKHYLQTVLTAVQAVFTEHHIDQIDHLFTEDFIQHSPLIPPDNASREGLKNGSAASSPRFRTWPTSPWLINS